MAFNALSLLPTAQRAQSAYETLSEQISSGKRLSKPSDDPAAMAQAIGLKASISSRGSYMNNASTGLERIGAQEQAMARATEALMTAKESVIQAGNATVNENDLKLLAKDIRAAYEELMASANMRTPQGGFVFSGFKDVQPFTQTTGAANYVGDQGQRELLVGEGDLVQVETNGAEAFKPGTSLDMFKVLSDIATQLESGASLANVSATVGQLDAGINHYSDVRAGMGARMKRFESALDFQTQVKTNEQKALSRLEDTDIAAAATQMANVQTQLEATYKVIASMNETRRSVLNMLG
jgi:flagellar hook-associated protein 3 FlgL